MILEVSKATNVTLLKSDVKGYTLYDSVYIMFKTGKLLYLKSYTWLHLGGERNDWHGVQGETSEVLVNSSLFNLCGGYVHFVKILQVMWF